MAERAKKFMALIVLVSFSSALLLHADVLPDNELQAVVNGYFDNFRVNILYPTISITKRLSGSTSVTGRYLVDAITAASMRSRFEMDGVTSATSSSTLDGVTSASLNKAKYPESTFDEVRHEFNAGLFQLVGDGSISINGLFSTEHDYRSLTVAGQLSYPFAMNNTVVQLGFVLSRDQVYPDTRDWTRRKNVRTFSAGLTQVLTQKFIMQANFSMIQMSGFLSDPYQPVSIISNDSFVYHQSVLPDSRLRKAASLRANWMWYTTGSIQLGYRYYWDDWDIRSHTANILIQQYAADRNVRFSLGLRHYIQQKADFFSEEYTGDQGFLTVDSKLNDLWSNEFELGMTVKGSYFNSRNRLHSDNLEYNLSFGFYQRQSPIPDWFSGYNTLYAYTFSVGVRYRF